MRQDEAVFRRDILPLSGRLFRVALAIVGNREEAEDVVQDVMLRLWEKRDAWSTIGNFEAWCVTAVRNAAVDRTRTHHELSPLEGDDLRTASTTPHDHLVANEGKDALIQILDTLPEVQRSIFVLREMEGKSYTEMGQILGLSESQVKTYLLRARRKIMAGMKGKVVTTQVGVSPY